MQGLQSSYCAAVEAAEPIQAKSATGLTPPSTAAAAQEPPVAAKWATQAVPRVRWQFS
jgi:hypothetical protein